MSGRSGLFIAARMQSHSLSAEGLLFFKAHNNRTKTQARKLRTVLSVFHWLSKCLFLIVYLCHNNDALSCWSFSEIILIVTKSILTILAISDTYTLCSCQWTCVLAAVRSVLMFRVLYKSILATTILYCIIRLNHVCLVPVFDLCTFVAAWLSFQV